MSAARRFLHSLSLALFALGSVIGPLPAHAVLKAVQTAGPPSNVAITGGSITGVTGAPFLWKAYHIPIIVLPTTTYGNNGAITLGTALPTVYANAYVVVPANSIDATTPAATAIYYATFTTTTAGTIFNNLLSANVDSVGGPTIPASPTAFVTTGAGSVAGVTATTTLLTLALPASTLSANGMLDLDFQFAANSSVNAKAVTVGFGAAANVFSNSHTSTVQARFLGRVRNRNSASVQSAQSGLSYSTGLLSQTEAYLTQNTANAVNIIIQAGHGTATDTHILEGVDIRVTNP